MQLKHKLVPLPLLHAGNSSRGLAEGAAVAEVALAAAVNLPALAEQMLAKQEAQGGSEHSGTANAAPQQQQQQSVQKSAILSAASVVAAAAGKLAEAMQQQQQQPEAGQSDAMSSNGNSSDAATAAAAVGPSASEVQVMLEEEMQALDRLLDGR